MDLYFVSNRLFFVCCLSEISLKKILIVKGRIHVVSWNIINLFKFSEVDHTLHVPSAAGNLDINPFVVKMDTSNTSKFHFVPETVKVRATSWFSNEIIIYYLFLLYLFIITILFLLNLFVVQYVLFFCTLNVLSAINL